VPGERLPDVHSIVWFARYEGSGVGIDWRMDA
jgi:hypothetical protein